MTEPWLVGVDIGGTAAKAAIYSVSGELIAIERVEYFPTRFANGGVEYRAEDLLSSACIAVKAALQCAEGSSKRIIAVGIDGMISGAVGIGKDGEPTTSYTTTLDSRYQSAFDWAVAQWGDSLATLSGSERPTIVPKALWVRSIAEDVFRDTCSWLTASAFVGMKFAGLSSDQAYVDRTQLWAYGVANSQSGEWSNQLCDAVDFPIGRLPQIVSSSDVIGGISEDVASATGLIAGTPVIAGTGDTLAGLLGAGVTRQGEAGDGAGSYSTLAVCLDSFIAPQVCDGIHVVAGAILGSWYALSFIDGGGLYRKWCANLLLGDEPELDAVTQLSLAAEEISPGSDGLRFMIPVGTGDSRLCAPKPGGWIGMNLSHRREHFYRSVLEAIAYRQADSLEIIGRDLLVSVKTILTYGGGSQELRWNQIKADVAGCRYQSLGNLDVTSLGAALVAGFAVGAIEDPSSVARSLKDIRSEFEPSMVANSTYKAIRRELGSNDSLINMERAGK